MKLTVEMQQYVCDGCGKEYNVNEEADGPPPGYHGTVTHHSAERGNHTPVGWYADKPKCIRNAILSVVNGPNWTPPQPAPKVHGHP